MIVVAELLIFVTGTTRGSRRRISLTNDFLRTFIESMSQPYSIKLKLFA